MHASEEEEYSPESEDYDCYGNEPTTVKAKKIPVRLIEEVKYCRSIRSNQEHKFHSIFEPSSLVEATRKAVVDKEIGLIVLGTKGTTDYEGSEIGSNTGDIITKVKCPTLVIPQLAQYNGLRNMALLTDYNSVYKNKILHTLSESMRLHAATLRILHVKTQQVESTLAQEDNKTFLQYYVKDKKHSFHFVNNKKIELGIQAFVELWEIDLIAILAKNINFFQRLLFRPTVKSLGYHKRIPFLVLHE